MHSPKNHRNAAAPKAISPSKRLTAHHHSSSSSSPKQTGQHQQQQSDCSRLRVAEYTSASADVLQAEVQHVQDALQECQAAYSRALADVNRSTAKIQQLQEHVRCLQQEDALLSAKVPLPVNRLCRVRQWLSEKTTALQSEQAALQGKHMALLKAESKLRSQETEASLLDEAATNLNTAAAAAATAASLTAADKHDREEAAARRQLLQAAAHRQQEQQQVAEKQRAADERSRTAASSQAAARQRLAGSQTAIKAGAAAVGEAAAGQHTRHWQSLLQLKTKVDEVREAVAKKAEKTRQLRKQKKEQEQREFEALQEQGLNPYEVYRVRDAEAAAAAAAAHAAAKQQQRKAEVAAALVAEEKVHRRQREKQDFDQQVEDNYQRQMGVTAQQQRTDAYMRSHTLTHQAILNPTSRVPVYPSEAVLVKPVAFGLGRASPEAVRKVAARHASTSASAAAAGGELQDCLLLPSKYRTGHLSSLTVGGDDNTAAAHSGEESEADSEEARDVDSSPTNGSRTIAAAATSMLGSATDSSSSSSRQHRGQHNKQKQLQAVQLSKLEAATMLKAKQQHKELIAQPKTAFGRVFDGSAFIADPPAINFKDFVPGQTYRTSVQLINRSFTGSSIRLVEVPTEVMHVLELSMPPSGCLAPGAAATLRVTFKPQADEPLSASIPLLADSGPLTLPFQALVRQALPSIHPSPTVSVDGRAGGVMLGASGNTSVSISNAGVLPMLYSVKVVGPLAATTEYNEPPGPPAPADASEEDLAVLQAKTWATASLAVAGIRVLGTKGRVQGYGSCSFRVEFSPKVTGGVEVPVLVSFSAPDSKGLVIPPIPLTLTATGKELPVSTLTPVVDFKCVMFGQTYTAPLLLANAGKSAMKVLVAARPELAPWVTFSPDFGFIQASDTLSVGVTLKPTPDMTHKLSKYLLPQTQDSFEIPVQVSVPGQPLPLPIKLRAQATTSDLILTPNTTLDFGRVPLTEAAGVYVTISNPSALPQGFSFGAKLPLGLKLSPNAGYGRVLPQGSVRLLATFQPPIPGLQYFDLTCKTLAGRVFRLAAKCDGLQPSVTLSHNVVRFPATACEDSSSASLVIRNTSSNSSHVFEFGVPAGSCLKVTPRVGALGPQSSMRVQVDFSPPAAALQQPVSAATAAVATAAAAAPVANAALTQGGAAGAAAQGVANQQTSQQASEQQQQQQPGHFQEWLLPCFIREAEATTTSSGGLVDSSSSGNAMCTTWAGSGMPQHQQQQQMMPAVITNSSSSGSSGNAADYVLHVSVATCAIAPELHLVSPQLPKPAGKNFVVLDFGALPVGERTTRELLLQNTGADVAPLIAAPLDPLIGAFSLVNALRPLEPSGGQGRVLLAFSPPDCCEYQETLTLRSAKSRLRVCLKGRGIAPTLSITPATATTTGGLAFGDVLLSDPVCKELKLVVTNTCPFTISYSTRFIGPPPKQPGVAAVRHAEDGVAVAAAGKGAGTVAAAAAVGAAKSQAGASAAPAAAVAAPAATAAAVKPLATGASGAATQAVSAAASAQGPSQTAAVVAAATAESAGQPSGCFVCKPSGGVLQAGQSQELTVVFAPLGLLPQSGVAAAAGGAGLVGGSQAGRGSCICGPLSPYVADRLQVLVPHQQQDVVVLLHGNAWPDGVFVSGVAYERHSSSSINSSSRGVGACGMSAVSDPMAQDPFAAVMLAASAAAAAIANTTSGNAAVGGSSKSAKQTAASAAAAATAASSSQQHHQGGKPSHAQQQLPAILQPRDLPAALAAAGYCNLAQGFVLLPGPVNPGQVSSAAVDFGAIKSSAGGAAGELVVEELPAEAREAGWSVDPVKLTVPAGEKRPLIIRFTAPPASKLAGTALGVLAGPELRLPVQQSVWLSVVMKGGCQPMLGAVYPAVAGSAADGSRRVTLVCSVVLAPTQPDG